MILLRLLRLMKLRISIFFVLVLFAKVVFADIYQNVLKQAASQSGYASSIEINPEFEEELANIGKQFFESKKLSYNSSIACKDCHLSEFSSTDGLPNAVGVGGHGSGAERLSSQGQIVPRNVLPLWGRGSKFFNRFFWDGKVEKIGPDVVSQFFDKRPTDNPLILATLLPIVEIREMVVNDLEVDTKFKKEDVDIALDFYSEIFDKISDEPMMQNLANHYKVPISDIDLIHVGSAISEHFKKEFRLKPTKFEKFMNDEISLDEKEIKGGILFYGKGRCSACHNGPLFSDLDFHSVIFPQTGFGKNGFGVDYGRFNVTNKVNDLYKFRTPPLIEVENTAPYGHSGSSYDLAEAIVAHFDPFRFANFENMSAMERTEYFRTIQQISNKTQVPYLDDLEIENLVSFMKTLSFIE